MKKILKEWKRFIQETQEVIPSLDVPELEEQPLPASALNGELYYVFPQKYLWNIAHEGIMDFREPQYGTEEISKEEGVLLYNDFSEASKAANAAADHLILVFDGTILGASGQYDFYPENTEPGVFKTRVKMRDSAVDSGHGASDLVDQLGTVLPLDHAKGVLFGTPLSDSQKASLKSRGLGELHLGSYAATEE